MIGRTLGNYRIIEQIGLGGMATVFKGYDPDTDRYVAVKILPQQFSTDPQFRERFQREAKAIAKLEHIHILPIFAYGEDDGISYMVMRYLPAGTLTDRIGQGALPFDEASRILNQLASALDHAHANGILHRDMKPSNVLLDDVGNAYLMDFGIAKIVEATIDLTGDRLLGTPAYMSPEQCKGEKVGPASDIYSLGIILYEMVTGRRPFHAETPVAVILQQLNDPLPPPRELRPDLPAKAENVIFKALAKNPESRYQSAGDLAAAFAKAIAEGETAVGRTRPIAAPSPPPAPEPTPPTPAPEAATIPAAPRRQLPAWAWGIIGVLAAVLLIGGGFFLANRSRDDEGQSVVDTGETEPAATAVPVPDTPPPPDTPQPPEQPETAALPPAPQCEPGQTRLFFDDFEDGKPDGWDFSDVSGSATDAGWEILQDGDNHVLVGRGHHWAVPPNVFGQDVALRLKMRPDQESDFHVNVRLAESRYYIAPGSIYRDPTDFHLADWPYHPDGGWHEMRIQVKDKRLQLFWDGILVADEMDPELIPGGQIGLENTGGTTWYDDILLCGLPPEKEPPPPASNLRFTNSGQSVGEGSCGKPALGDLNGDGALDIFIPHGVGFETWINDGQAKFSKGDERRSDDPEGLCGTQAVLGDLDGDGDLDAFVGVIEDETGGDNIVWLNDGGGVFSDSGQRLGGSQSWSVALGDFDEDGDLDVFDASGGPSEVWFNEGDGRFADSGQSLGGGDSVSVALGDLDGDGDLDAFVANGNRSAPNAVWFNDGRGIFTHSGQLLGDSSSWAVALGDLDGDGDLDAFVGNGGSGLGGSSDPIKTAQANTVWLNEGNGRFGDSGLRLGNDFAFAVVLTDLNGDGNLDAFVDSEDGNTVWLNQTVGAETAVQP